MTSWRWPLALAGLLALAGCRTPVMDVHEVLGAPRGQRLFTAYNLWHVDGEIPSSNYHVGTILPFGTEVEVVRLTETELAFRTLPEGQPFRLRYRREYQVEAMATFLAKLLVAEDAAAQAAGMSEPALRAARAGMPVPGMTKAEVIKALGYPARHRTPSIDLDAWIYWRTPNRSGRVFFKDGKVLEVHF